MNKVVLFQYQEGKRRGLVIAGPSTIMLVLVWVSPSSCSTVGLNDEQRRRVGKDLHYTSKYYGSYSICTTKGRYDQGR